MDVSAGTGIALATVSKFTSAKEHVQRWPNAEHWDALSGFFRVAPHVLLKPDEALRAGRPPDTGIPASAQWPSPTDDVGVNSALPLLARSVDVADPTLFRKLLAYWSAMEPAQHAELVRVAWEMSNPGASAPTPSVGFKRG